MDCLTLCGRAPATGRLWCGSETAVDFYLVVEALLIVGGLGKVGAWSVPVGKDSSELAAALVRLKI
jgi:hypothetical protein